MDDINEFELLLKSKLLSSLRNLDIKYENVYVKGLHSIIHDEDFHANNVNNINYTNMVLFNESVKREVGNIFLIIDMTKFIKLLEINPGLDFVLTRYAAGVGGVKQYDSNGELMWHGLLSFR